MSGMAEGRAPGQGDDDGDAPESLAEVLASIRALVSEESRSRQAPGEGPAGVLMLTPAMRADAPTSHSGEILTDGLDARGPRHPAPILDEEALRDLVNDIVREELQGELGERISRNLRRLIRRELAQMIEPPREE